MDTINILVTGAGAPGIMGTLDAIGKLEEKVKIIGVDISEDSVGKYLVDEFAVVPKPDTKEFIPVMIDLVKKYKVNVIVPQVTRELEPLAKNKALFAKENCVVLVNDYEALQTLNSKYLLLEAFKEAGITTPNYELVKTKEELKAYCTKQKYPENRVVVKLPISNGMRGLKILSEDISKKELFYDKPGDVYEDLDSFLNYFSDEDFPELLATEYLPGKEVTVDCLAKDGKSYIVLPRSRDKIRTGITFQGEAVKDEDIITQCEKIIKHLSLSHMFGFQFKYDTNGKPLLLESNPRVQGTMALSSYCNANVIKGAIQLALGKKLDTSQEDIEWNVRITRYWGGVMDKNGEYKGKF